MKKTLIAALFALQWNPAFSGDLLQTYRDATDHDAQLAIARANVVAGREKSIQGRSQLLPSVILSGDLSRIDSERSPGNIESSGQTTTWAASLTQPLYRRQNWIAYRQSGIQVEQAEITYVQAQQDLIVRVAQAYFDVLYAQESLLAVQSQKVAIKQQLELAQKSFEVGTATITDTHEAQARYDLAIAQEIAVESDLEVKRRNLQTLTGKDVGALPSLRPDIQMTPPEPQNIDQWVTDAEKNSLAVRIQQTNSELAEREAEKARAAHQPTLDLVAKMARSSDSDLVTSPYTSTQTQSIGLQLVIPLYQGGATSSKVREVAAQRDAALAGLNNARRTAVLQTRQSYLGVTNGISQVLALQAALKSSNLALDATKVGYEVGVRINNDVLDAEQQVLATRRDLAKARLDTLMAQIKLSAAVGALSEEDLQKINGLLSHH